VVTALKTTFRVLGLEVRVMNIITTVKSASVENNVLNKSKIVSNLFTLLIFFSSSILATEIPFILKT
jgi:hypothetical protein